MTTLFPQIPTTRQELIDAIIAAEPLRPNSRYFFDEATIENLQTALINKTNVLGKVVDMDSIEEISWDGNWSDHTDGNPYDKFQDWVGEQILRGDTYYYSRPKEDFFISEAYRLAVKYGKTKLILENLS